MADYTKQIFEMLGVEPKEEFRASYKGCISDRLFRFLDDLTLEYKYKNNWFFTSELKDFLNGSWKILKNHPTAEEQLAIDYARACGMKWLAKNTDKTIWAFSVKPIKAEDEFGDPIDWHILGDGKTLRIGIPISFIHCEDEEPYYIGD